MEHSPVQLTFSVIPNQHLKWRKRYQVEIAIPIAEAPNILRTGGAFPPLYAIAMGNEVENKVAIELSLEALDMFATGPTDISVRKDDAHLYIVVRDIAPLMPEIGRAHV